MKKSDTIAVLLAILFAEFSLYAIGEDAFDVRKQLSTVSRYGAVKDILSGELAVASEIPDQCTPIHLNLVARHGTRAPTKKKIMELDALSSHLEVLVKDAKEKRKSLEKVPAWMRVWKSPWKGKRTGGELIAEGEDELYNLGIRIRGYFPDLFKEEYHPDVYTIKASQVPRASASAVAFGMGLFSARGKLGPGKNRAFAVSSESRASDIILRFHDCCQSYKEFRKSQQPTLDKLKEPVLNEITKDFIKKYGLNFTRQDISSLWFLCKQEASLLNITGQACSLFKGHPQGSYETARLRFAHAETLLPFSCLIGLFLKESEFDRIQKEEVLQLPPKPPQKRNWRGSVVAPFAGNNMLVLYSCSAQESSKYYVHVLHNEHPIPMPGCNGSAFCPFEVFKNRIAAPHMKLDYNTLCYVIPSDVVTPSVWSRAFAWLFSPRTAPTPSPKLLPGS
ncbi:unnamed protein product [Cuscuta campestris]|uniref:Multiple inositol polyphosphate phosphatase 1 n=1 Tax=Cuscuta campestris TaxID=132261 RepID=A0A484MP42_9ASTE|nr:unnamed protein product [Cuscuta campestris]